MYKYKLKEIEVGDVETQKGQKTTVTDIDPRTGGITWSVEDVAAFDTAYKSFDKIRRFLKKLSVAGESKDDTKIDTISDQMNSLFNEFRTHVRKNYPDQYKRIKRLKEGDEEGEKDVQTIEKLLKKINNKKEWGELINKLVSHEVPSLTGMGKKQHLLAITKQLKEDLSIKGKKVKRINKNNSTNPEDYTVEYEDGTSEPYVDTLEESVNESMIPTIRDINKMSKDQLIRIQGILFGRSDQKKILNAIRKRLEQIDSSISEDEGISYLTPKAFDKNKKSTGASDIYYYKLGFKPVPKKIKGAGTIVKQLWEKEELTEYNDFQQKRIGTFDEVEEKLNSLAPLLSNAKNETAKYYNENPGSYAVVYSTDMIGELLDDITDLLKQEE